MIAPFVIAGVLATAGSAEAEMERMTPREKAAMVVVSGLPAPNGVAGVIVRRWDRQLPRPPSALVFVDQEGGDVKAFPELPPWQAASTYRTPAEARFVGRETGRALREAGVHVDLAPVLDSSDGPLGSRHFREPEIGVGFARGLAEGGAGACAKHFPGLGSTRISTDLSSSVRGVVRSRELAAFRAAIRQDVPCVMVSHAFYRTLGRARASLDPAAYRLLRALGFEGVAITDSLNFIRAAPAEEWSRRAVRAGADLLLFTHPAYARRAIDALVPLAEAGELDVHVARVLRWRRKLLAR
jgi:beta-N-acetylhexosaminidase